jgi:hypothetical protein
MTDGNLRNGKIISDDGNFVKYVNAEGTMFSIKKDYIKEIHYQNPPKGAKQFSQNQSGSSNSIMAVDVLAVLYGNLAFSFQRISENGKIGLRFPISFLAWDLDLPFITKHLFQAGLDVNYFPSNRGAISYFIGPGFRTGTVEAGDNIADAFEKKEKSVESGHFTVLLNNGVIRNSKKGVSLSVVLSTGLRRFSNKEFSDGGMDPMIRIEFGIGKTF